MQRRSFQQAGPPTHRFSSAPPLPLPLPFAATPRSLIGCPGAEAHTSGRGAGPGQGLRLPGPPHLHPCTRAGAPPLWDSRPQRLRGSPPGASAPTPFYKRHGEQIRGYEHLRWKEENSSGLCKGTSSAAKCLQGTRRMCSPTPLSPAEHVGTAPSAGHHDGSRAGKCFFGRNVSRSSLMNTTKLPSVEGEA